MKPVSSYWPRLSSFQTHFYITADTPCFTTAEENQLNKGKCIKVSMTVANLCVPIYIYIVCPDFNQQGFTGQPERTCCDWFGDVALISRTPWVFPGRAKITDLDRQKLVESQIVGFHLKQVFQKTPNWLASLKVFNLILYFKKKWN